MQFISVLFQLNRRTVSKLNVAQLQLIQNDYLSQIQGLNEELVSLLVRKVGNRSLTLLLVFYEMLLFRMTSRWSRTP